MTIIVVIRFHVAFLLLSTVLVLPLTRPLINL